MKCSTFFTPIPAILLGIGISLCLIALPLSAQTPVEDLFELEGNAIDETLVYDGINDGADDSAPDDWGEADATFSLGYVAGPGVDGILPGGDAHISAFIDDPNGESGTDDIFTGGGSKDDLPINGWLWTDGGPPDKDDLLQVGAAAYLPGLNELLIYDFGSLYTANGTSSIGNWFFKKDIGPCSKDPKKPGKFGVVDSNDPNRPCLPDEDQPDSLHTLGDVLIISENSNGGTVTNISLYTWVAGDASVCEDLDPGFSFVPPKNNLCLIGEYASATCDMDNTTDPYACGVMNQVSTESPDDYGFLPKFPPDPAAADPNGTDGIGADDYPAYSFFESGINITKLLGSTECFSSFMKNTRTSASPRSQLKDFASGAFELCGIEATKHCDATLTAAGDQVDVVFDGTVSNTGVVALEIVLYDDAPDSLITAVCFDDNVINGVCDGTDSVPADLAGTGTDVATFTLGPGETVLYEGFYLVTGPITILSFTDIITADAYLGSIKVDSADATDTCTETGTPSIFVEKNCNAQAIADGTLMEVTVFGGGENTGNVKLVNVTLTDLVDTAVQNALVITRGGTPVTNGAFDLEPSQTFAFTATVTESDISHSDVIKAEGTNFFDASETVVWQDAAGCGLDAVPGISVSKTCKPALNINDEVAGKIVIQIDFFGDICNTSPILGLTDVSLTDDQAGLVSLSKATLAPSECISYTGSYFPAATFSGGAPPNTSLFWDEVTATGIGTLGTGPVQDTADDECTLCE